MLYSLINFHTRLRYLYTATLNNTLQFYSLLRKYANRLTRELKISSINEQIILLALKFHNKEYKHKCKFSSLMTKIIKFIRRIRPITCIEIKSRPIQFRTRSGIIFMLRLNLAKCRLFSLFVQRGLIWFSTARTRGNENIGRATRSKTFNRRNREPQIEKKNHVFNVPPCTIVSLGRNAPMKI